MKDTRDGVLLTGHLRYLLDRLIFGGAVLFTAIFVAIAVVNASTPGGESAEVSGPLIGGSVPGLLALFLVAIAPRNATIREEQAKQVLCDAYGSA